jgi:hypothetical protein
VSSAPIACLPYVNACGAGTFCSSGRVCYNGACVPAAPEAAAAVEPVVEEEEEGGGAGEHGMVKDPSDEVRAVTQP